MEWWNSKTIFIENGFIFQDQMQQPRLAGNPALHVSHEDYILWGAQAINLQSKSERVRLGSTTELI